MKTQNDERTGGADDARESRCEDILPLVAREHVPLIVEFQVLEDGKHVMARGTCFLASCAGQDIVLNGFTPKTLLRLLKPDMDLAVRLSRDGKGYQAAVKVRSLAGDRVTVTAPDRLQPMTRRFVRITPSAANPVQVYVLMPNLPTARLTAVEVSQRGLSFFSVEGLEKGSSSAFTIILPDPPAIILSSGTIRYKRGHENGFLYGVELHIHPRDEEYLARYIMQREREIRELL